MSPTGGIFPSEPRVLIGGVGYGLGNVGDEGILEGIVQDIRSVIPAVDITALTWSTEATANLLGVRAVRTRIQSVVEQVARSDVIICGGASIIAEYYDKHASITEKLKSYPGYPLTLVTLAKVLRKKVMVYAVGVEPIESPWFKRWVARSLSLVDAFTVRDEASKQLLSEWGDVSRVTVAADPAFNLSPPPAKVTDEFLRAQGLEFPNNALLVGMSFAYEPRFVKKLDEQIDFFTELAQELIVENNAYIILIPMNTNPVLDCQGLTRVAQRLPTSRVAVLKGNYYPSQVIGLVSRLDLVISSRMHLLIFSAIANTPFAAVSRGPKIDAFARRLGTEPVARVEALDVPLAKARIDEIVESIVRQKDIISRHFDGVRSSLEVNRRLLKELLASSRI
jgi:polysaccharide pyruvyl transferase CsaB